MDKVRVYRDDAGEYRWAKFAANGKEVADSGEGYINFHDALNQGLKELPDGGTLAVPYAHSEAVTKTDLPENVAVVEEGDDVGQVVGDDT